MNKAALKLLMVFPGTILAFQGPVWAKDRDMGQVEYESFCAVCHGIDAKGNGPIAAQLKIAPADLTQLAKKNGGVFPRNAVYETIDGRQETKAHGPRDMPVWGRRFMPLRTKGFKPTESVPWDVPNSERTIRRSILSLVDYLYRIQEK
jgi:hypothetical protein